MVGAAGVGYVLKCGDTQHRTIASAENLRVEREQDAVRAERERLKRGRWSAQTGVGSERSPRVLELHPQVDAAATRRFTLRLITDSLPPTD